MNLARERQGRLLSFFAQLQQCRFYSRPRGPLWRGRKGIGKEALHVLGEVKRTKYDNIQLGNTFRSKVARLLKTDLLAVLQELQRQNEVDLALRAFNLVRKEDWYKPDLYVYKDMLHTLARSKRVDDCEKLLKDFKLEGLPPDGLLLTEVMTAYLECGMLPQAMETFDGMRKGSVPPDLPAFKVLLRYLKKMGQKELRRKIRSECLEFYEGIVESKHRRREESDEEEAEIDWHQVTNAEGIDDKVMGMERQQRLQHRNGAEKGKEIVWHQRPNFTESDDVDLETEEYEESDEEVEIERHQRAKHDDNDDREEMEHHRRSKFTESDEEGWQMEEYKESDKRAKHEDSVEKEEEMVRDQRSKFIETDEEEWQTEENEDSDEEEWQTEENEDSDDEEWQTEENEESDEEEVEIESHQRAKHEDSDRRKKR